jgi:hypothetical protein
VLGSENINRDKELRTLNPEMIVVKYQAQACLVNKPMMRKKGKII